ncbi:helix-turn-helix domain-containing protein [Bacillus mycoides]|uniref:helix-turn-helix domain-containing protein n=1 Tax=Bacillus mycoides TaxID=1405 RepID=UPI0011A35B76|nr:helix-turn-helix domain-containing protein [Bacillus mycoides]
MPTPGKKYGVNKRTIRRWIDKFERNGYKGLEDSKSWKMYSVEQKQEAIQAILTGKYSLQEATKIYNISTDTLLRKWVTKYTSGEIVNYSPLSKS